MAFGFASIGHFFAASAHGVVQAARVIAHVQSKLSAASPTIEAVTQLISPQAAQLERGAFAVFGVVAAAVEAAGEAAAQNGVSVSLDAALVADIQAVLPAVKAFAGAQGWVKP